MKSTNNNLDELNIISLDEEKDTTSVEDSSSISHNDFDIKSRREKHLKRKKRSRIFLLVFFIVVILGVGGYFGTIKYTEAKYKNNDEVAKYISSNNVNTLIDFKGSDKELLSANIPVSSVDTDKSFAQKYKSLKFSKNITLDLLDLNNNSVLLSYNSRKKIYPASTTKIMTALLAIESGKLDDVVTVKTSETKFAWDEQVIGFKAGDKVTIRELLKGLIVYSGNDAAVIIADHLAGSVPAFSEKMNARAKELGAFNTHFINPNGIHNPNHYTTAYDLCLIFNQCIKHEEFLNLVKLKNTTISFKDKKGKQQRLDFHSTNYYLTGKAEFPANLTIVGGKTGTTKAAGACLILLVKDKNGHNYISIVMDSKDHETLYQDMTKLLGCIKGD